MTKNEFRVGNIKTIGGKNYLIGSKTNFNGKTYYSVMPLDENNQLKMGGTPEWGLFDNTTSEKRFYFIHDINLNAKLNEKVVIHEVNEIHQANDTLIKERLKAGVSIVSIVSSIAAISSYLANSDSPISTFVLGMGSATAVSAIAIRAVLNEIKTEKERINSR